MKNVVTGQSIYVQNVQQVLKDRFDLQLDDTMLCIHSINFDREERKTRMPHLFISIERLLDDCLPIVFSC